ncbi:MAG: 4-alpha-glucanotransferase, partial [Planctomycetales bacterium]|nr:4-alpha-glucanotransferase [Planctomycetales bacterium]
MTRYERAAGILLHITSLPSDYGIGDLGEGAYRFVDFLAQAGQRIWQILPLGPTTRGDSPYSCYSAFAGNMLLISPTRLVALGLLQEADLPAARVANAEQAVDYAAARRGKSHLLRLAFDRFLQHSACEAFDEFEAFCTLQKWWLDDFALFSALMQHFETDDWCRWEPGLVGRQSGALSEWRERLASEIEYAQFVQYVFHCQWRDLQRYAAQRRVKLFGDMPIFVAHGSADVWSHQELFWLEPNGAPRFVAGVPPDYFSKTGQLWGNPLYCWEALAA